MPMRANTVDKMRQVAELSDINNSRYLAASA